MCHKIINFNFFPNSNPHGPLINRLKYFRIRFWFGRDIWSQSYLCSVQQTTKTISTLCNTPQRRSPKCVAHCRVRAQSFEKNLIGVHPTAEMISAMCNILWRWSLWCATHREMISVHTTEKILAVCSILGSQPGQCMQHSTELRAPTLKKIYSLCNPLLRQSQRCATHCRVDLSDVQHTAETISAVCNIHTAETNCTPWSQIKISGCFKGTIRKIILEVNTSILKENILSIKYWFARTLLWSLKPNLKIL